MSSVTEIIISERERALKSELHYWTKVVEGNNQKLGSQDSFFRRVKGERGFPKNLVKYLRTDGEVTRILDVGAGPCSSLGSGGLQSSNAKIMITGIDPLADKYNAMLDSHNLLPKFKTICGEGETLSNPLDLESYDIVYCKNALDHVDDPHKTLLEMKKVCAKGGLIYLMGRVNEAVHQNYCQLHQWNMLPCDGDLVVWDRSSAFSVKKMISNDGKVSATRVDTKNLISDADPIYHVYIELNS